MQVAPTGGNRLLACLQPHHRNQLLPHLEPVTLEYNRILYDTHQRIDAVYFIESGVASLVNTFANGDAAEVGMIGNEGVVGIPALLGSDEASMSVLVQVPGAGLRMGVRALREELEQCAPLKALMLRYANLLLNQAALLAACAHFHRLEQRYARWLLMIYDRTGVDEFPLTQEMLSTMLAVRRAGVSEAARALQRDGIIRYHRGRICILDPNRLQMRACECYAVLKTEQEALLSIPDYN